MSNTNSSSSTNVSCHSGGGLFTNAATKGVDLLGGRPHPPIALGDGDSAQAALLDELRFARMLSQLTGAGHFTPSPGHGQNEG